MEKILAVKGPSSYPVMNIRVAAVIAFRAWLSLCPCVTMDVRKLSRILSIFSTEMNHQDISSATQQAISLVNKYAGLPILMLHLTIDFL